MRGSSSCWACAMRTSHLMRHLHALMLCLWFSATSPLSSSCCLSSPRCGGQIPCALLLIRTLAMLPSTTLSQIMVNQPHFLTTKIWDVLNVKANRTRIFFWVKQKRCSNHEFLQEQLKNYQCVRNFTQRRSHGPTTWKDMLKSASRDCELANKKTEQQNKVSSLCLDDHHFKEEELKSVGECSKVCSQIVLKCLSLAWILEPDIRWPMNKFARSITTRTKSCHKRLSRLISYIHHTCEYRQYCYVGNTAKQYRLGLFQDSDFAGDLEDSKSTSGGTLCVSGSHTFVPTSWMCKKQTSVSHSSTESEIISLDAGLRLDGIPALELWDLIVAVLGNTNQNHIEQGDLSKNKREVCSPPHTTHTRKQTQRVINELDNVDFLPSNFQSSHQEAVVYVFEDNEAVIKMIMKGRSPTMRHVSRIHRVAIVWLFGRSNLDSTNQIKYIDTKNQLADTLTKGNFTRDKWNHLLCLFNISHFISTDCSEVMSKRTQKDSGEERVTTKSKPMMNLVSRCSERTPDVLPYTASESPVKTRHESQFSLSSQTEQHHRTGQPVVDAYSSSYSQWNVD